MRVMLAQRSDADLRQENRSLESLVLGSKMSHHPLRGLTRVSSFATAFQGRRLCRRRRTGHGDTRRLRRLQAKNEGGPCGHGDARRTLPPMLIPTKVWWRLEVTQRGRRCGPAGASPVRRSP